MRAGMAEIADTRPFFDTEHGPIHTFKDHHRTLPEEFDDEYFRHMQWAHFASGGVGGGMRWPNRHPHVLTSGMRAAQRVLAAFLPLIDWQQFRRRNLNEETTVETPGFAPFACGDERQAVVWLLRTDAIGENGMLRRDAPAIPVDLRIPGLQPGRYRVEAVDPLSGAALTSAEQEVGSSGELRLRTPPIITDLALAVRPGR
jgi:mannan endo-1,4-beta-mannosidase